MRGQGVNMPQLATHPLGQARSMRGLGLVQVKRSWAGARVFAFGRQRLWGGGP
jgi:hypothetical protein